MRPIFLCVLCILSGSTASADDWPQWQGPRGDGIYREPNTLTNFPPADPKILWRTPIAAGYSSPSISSGRIYLTDRLAAPKAPRPRNALQRVSIPGAERVLCLDESDGKLLWKFEYPADYTMAYNAGPRAQPAIDGDRLYAVGAEGQLHCIDTKSGKPLWSKTFPTEDNPTPTWGYAAAPLVYNDKLICLTGGHGSLVTAYNKLTGETLWQSLSAKEPGYCAPTLIHAGGRTQLIVWHPEALVSLDPDTGKTFWSKPFPVRSGLSIPTPRLYHDPNVGDLLFVTSFYSGSMMMKLDPAEPKATKLWKRAGRSERMTDALHSIITTPWLQDGHIYGVDAYGQFRCLKIQTGDRLWESFAPTTGATGPIRWATTFITPYTNGTDQIQHYFLAADNGDLITADLSPAGYHELSRAHLLQPTNTDPGHPVLWSHPAYANHHVYWRNDKELICASLTP
jgi:outer membrane protein assembly factor BamB